MHEIDAIDNADRARGDKVARDHAHGGAGHRCIGQALAEGRFNLEAQLACGLLGAVERHRIGHPDAMRVARRMALGRQLLIDLGPKTMDQHDLDTQRLDQGQILGNRLQLARCNRLTCHAHYKSLVAKLMDIRRHRAEPGHKGEIEYSGHGGGVGVFPRSTPDRWFAAAAIVIQTSRVCMQFATESGLRSWGKSIGAALSILAGAKWRFRNHKRRRCGQTGAPGR